MVSNHMTGMEDNTYIDPAADHPGLVLIDLSAPDAYICFQLRPDEQHSHRPARGLRGNITPEGVPNAGDDADSPENAEHQRDIAVESV